jgi:hypothetical protein
MAHLEAVGSGSDGRLGRRAIVPVVQPAHVRRHDDGPCGRWHDGARDRRVLAKREMGNRVLASLVDGVASYAVPVFPPARRYSHARSMSVTLQLLSGQGNP